MLQCEGIGSDIMSKTDNVNGYEDKKTINWYPGHMAKTKRELKENINLIDVVYEVIDARMPISSKIIDIEDILRINQKFLLLQNMIFVIRMLLIQS